MSAEAGAKSGKEEEIAQLKFELGLTVGLPHVERVIPVEQLVVDQTADQRRARQFGNNVSLFGLLHNPIVVPVATESESEGDMTLPQYRVVDGRHRVLAAREAGLTEVTCRVYQSLTAEQEAALVLSTNQVRKPNPAAETLALRDLLLKFTPEQIARLLTMPTGKAISQRIKIALLPTELVDALATGGVTLAILKQVASLPPTQIQELAELARGGQPVTAELVRSLREKEIADQIGFAELDETFEVEVTTAVPNLPLNQEQEPEVVSAITVGEPTARLQQHLAALAVIRQDHIGDDWIEGLTEQLEGLLRDKHERAAELARLAQLQANGEAEVVEPEQPSRKPRSRKRDLADKSNSNPTNV